MVSKTSAATSNSNASLNTFVRVMMALQRTRYFFMLFPQEPVSKRSATR